MTKAEPVWFTKYLQPCVAEFFASTVLVFAATMSINTEFIMAIALTHGFTYATLIASFGNISGGHVNPAVTLAVCLVGGIRPLKAFFYFISQTMGGITGAAICRGSLSYIPPGENQTRYLLISGGAHTRPPGVPVMTAILVEMAMTVHVVMTVLMTTVAIDLPIHPVVIGFSVIVDIIMGLSVTGASMNPMRSFGPAVVISDIQNLWADQWIYWVGPGLGAILAAIIYRIILGPAATRESLSKGIRPLSSAKKFRINVITKI